MGTKQKHVVFIYFWAQMQFCVLPLEYLNVDLKCVHMVRIHQNLFSSAKLRRDFSSFLIQWKKDGWLTMPKRWTDCHTRHALILMVVSTFLVKKHLNIYVWQAKRETFLCWFWEKSQNERNPPSSSNNFNKSSAGWQPRERQMNKKVINTYKCKWIQEEMCSSCYLRADLSSGFPVVCL